METFFIIIIFIVIFSLVASIVLTCLLFIEDYIFDKMKKIVKIKYVKAINQKLITGYVSIKDYIIVLKGKIKNV